MKDEFLWKLLIAIAVFYCLWDIFTKNNETSPTDPPKRASEKPANGELAEVRALYDIRIKEVHHYNTVVWAFPPLFITFISAATYHFRCEPLVLFACSLFACPLCYMFVWHVKNKASVIPALRAIEKRMKAHHPADFFPIFKVANPHVTTVMMWSILVGTALFFGYALSRILNN